VTGGAFVIAFRPASGRPASVNFYFERHLLINHIANFLVNVYKVCLNKSLGVKIGPALGVIDFPYIFIAKT
jgi:hypothetical protein